MIQAKLKKKLLQSLDKIQSGSIDLTLPDGSYYQFQGNSTNQPKVKVEIHHDLAISAISAKGDVGLLEAYRNGWLDVDCLENLFTLALQNSQALNNYIYGGFLAKFVSQIIYLLRLNTQKGSKKNIHFHYDLGNQFYQLWLDSTMTYSAGIFQNSNQSLLNAQNNKYDRILDLLNQQSGQLLEIGCGWGGFINRALEQKDYQIKAITISDNQYHYVNQKLINQGNHNQANLIQEDYRIQKGKYDSIVSIEMFEAVGERYWSTYFNKVKQLLKPKGRAVIQTIHIDESQFEQYRKTGDMIRTYIFPGGMLPTRTRFINEASKAGLKLLDEHHFGADYAKTLSLWLERFQKTLPEIKQLGFDEAFIRIWQFYLIFCKVAFVQKRTNVSQFCLENS